MDQREIQVRIIWKLMNFHPAKWGASHTEAVNLTKCLPKHLRGRKETTEAIEELYRNGFLLRMKKTGEWHVSLNPEKKEEICRFLGWEGRRDER